MTASDTSGPIDYAKERQAEIRTATDIAVRAIQLMNQAGRERDEARATLERLRALHRRDGDYCAICTEDFGRLQAPWPCPTIQALDSAATEGSQVRAEQARFREWLADQLARAEARDEATGEVPPDLRISPHNGIAAGLRTALHGYDRICGQGS